MPVAAELRADIGLTGSGAAVFLLPFAAGFGVGSFLWFGLARRRPARLVLPLSLAMVALASVGLLVDGGEATMVTARVAVGIASAGFPAAAQTVITRAVDPRDRGRMIGGFVIAVVAGSFIGQALTGAIADAASVTVALTVVCVAAPLLVAAVLLRVLPDGPGPAPTGGSDVAGPSSGVWRLLVDQWPVLVVAALSFGGYWLMLSELPVVLRDERFALSAAQAGALPSLGLLGIATAIVAGRGSDRRGPRLPMVASLALGLAGLALTLPAGGPLWLFAGAYGVFLAAYWGYLPVASAEVAARSRPADRQPALMAFYAAMWTGAAVAPALGEVLDGWNAAALCVLGAWAVALVVAASRFTDGHHVR